MTSAVVTGSRGGIGSATVSAFEMAGFTVNGIDVDDDPAVVFGGLERLATAPFVSGAVVTVDGGWTAR